MNDAPLTCAPQTYLAEIERVIIDSNYAHHYMPVVEKDLWNQMVSLYDIFKAVLETKDFEKNLTQDLHQNLSQRHTASSP